MIMDAGENKKEVDMIDATMSLWETLGYNVQTALFGVGLFLGGFIFAKLASIGRHKD